MRCFLLFAGLASCALAVQAQVSTFDHIAGAAFNLPVTSIKQAKLAGTVLQQNDFSCGSAALATLLTYHYGHPVAEQTILRAMYETGDQQKIRKDGFSLLDMKRYLASLGFLADGFEQPLDKLLEARIPAVVLINENGYQHFVVIKGLKGERVLLGDPAKGTRVMSRSAFQSVWVGGLLFVIHNRMEMARFNQPSDWRAAPAAPLGSRTLQDASSGSALAKHGPGDF